ncbi:hypothetical protein [Nocardia sp. CA-120079]|uniref:hypothetical protein n=1 Tax=Nocardia sp. CA-120079 TaxID=3239974 RepID=UPI003D994E7C
MTVVEYEWGPASRTLISLYDVQTWEVMEVLYGSRRWPRPATTSEGLPVITVWGRTDEGRPLVIVLRRPRSNSDRWQIMIAAPMGPQQLDEYTAWEANRDD